MVKFKKSQETRRIGYLEETTTQEHYPHPNPRTHTEMPAWDALDRHVLRFYGYFKEAVVETNLENFRVRQCVVLYYLEDDTCQVITKKVDNSGIPGGQLIRRHRFPGLEGGYLSWKDLIVGDDLVIYGKGIRLTDCDDFTREWCAREGIIQGQPEPTEQDAFMRSQTEIRRRNMEETGNPRTAEKVYRENMLGGGHVNADMQQFLEWDRKVLRFYAVLDDLRTPQFERRPFIILFFLADDTVEIREQYPLNCGRDNFAIFFRRGKLARGDVEVRSPMEMPKGKEEHFCATDFSVGQMQSLLGYEYYIYDCDPFTRTFFQQELGITQLERQDVRLPERAVPRPATPPYTGYGTWDDSMGSVLQLMPSKPKKDFKKLYFNDGKIVRFTAQFNNAKPEDAERLFVVNFHLFDDTLSIHEPPQRNIGIITGRFLEKAVHLNQMTGKLFTADDLYVGAIIKVYNREFVLTDCDEYTRKLKDDPSSVDKPNYDLQAVIEKMRDSLKQLFPLVRDVFRRIDTDHDGVITFDEMKNALEKFGFQLRDTDVVIIMKHFDTRGDGQISYNEFCDALLDEDYTADMLKTKPPLEAEFDPEYAHRAMFKVDERKETESVRAAARRMTDVIYKHIHTFQRLCKEFGKMTHEPVVTIVQIRDALQNVGHTFQLDDVYRALLYVLPDADPEKVNYVQFLKALTTAFHDLANNK
jgi:Ca2+-binding EF-hand superfamily protein